MGVEIAFRLAGHDYWAFSSVPQIRSRYLRELLEGAQGMASLRPDDAAAVTMIAFERLRGWAEEVLGDVAIPDQMWIHSGHRAEDAFGMMSCADKRHEFVHAMLRLSATTVLKMSAASWVRLFTICRGHHVRVGDEALVFEHDATAAPVTQAQIAWAIETVARATPLCQRSCRIDLTTSGARAETDDGVLGTGSRTERAQDAWTWRRHGDSVVEGNRDPAADVVALAA